MEENTLQRSGLPREFDFVLLVYQPDEDQDIYLSVDVDPVVDAFFGSYPKWWINRPTYQPNRSYLFDFKEQVGQMFHPVTPGRGFNFARLTQPLDEYVALPGTVYPTNVSPILRHLDYQTDDVLQDIVKVAGADISEDANAKSKAPKTPDTSPKDRKQSSAQNTPNRGTERIEPHFGPPSNRYSWAPETMNVRVLIEHANAHVNANDMATRRYSGSPASYQTHERRRSIRRTRSRTGLKEYGAQQAGNEKVRDGHLPA